MGCKRVCDRFKAKRVGTDSHYVSGHKRCYNCEMFLNWEGLFCPCCGRRLRVKPRNAKAKKAVRDFIVNQIVSNS